MPYVIQAVGMCKGTGDAEVILFVDTSPESCIVGTFPSGEFELVKDFRSFTYRELNISSLLPGTTVDDCSVSWWNSGSIPPTWTSVNVNSAFPLSSAARSTILYFCIHTKEDGVAFQVLKG